MVVAAKKEAISERIKLVQDSGFKIKVIDVDSLALINAFNFNYHSEDEKDLPKVIALLNIGAAVSNLSILEAGVPVFSRDIYIAGNNFSKKIADALSIDLKAAEGLKINPDKEKLEKVSAAIELILSGLASEVRTSFDYYESQSSSSVEKIFLSGGGSLSLNLKDSLNRLLGIDIDYWDPTKRITFLVDQASSQQIKSYLRHFPVALGLAMR
jgi:type IV pilus assembly protein PilM